MKYFIFRRNGLSKTRSATGGGQTLSRHNTPTSHRTSLSRRSTENSSWCSCRKDRTLQCQGTTNWWQHHCLSSTITRKATVRSYRLFLRLLADSTSSITENKLNLFSLIFCAPVLHRCYIYTVVCILLNSEES